MVVAKKKVGITCASLSKRIDAIDKVLDDIAEDLASRIDCGCELSEVPIVKFCGVIPEPATEGAAGFDLIANSTGEAFPGRTCIIKTGTYAQIPKGYVGLIKCRSGLGFKRGAEVFQGVIDSDYRGEIKVRMANDGIEILNIKRGTRFAQLIVVPCLTVSEEAVLSDTQRGEAGFGSTGEK